MPMHTSVKCGLRRMRRLAFSEPLCWVCRLGFDIGGAKGDCCCEKIPETSHMSDTAMEHISDSGSASGIMYLRRGKNLHSGNSAGERSENV